MPKKTLLEIVQNVLLSMEYLGVSAIDESTESVIVADIAQQVYYELLTEADWPYFTKPVELQSLYDNTKPTIMRVPTTVNKIESLYYKKKEIKFLTTKEFFKLVNERKSTTFTEEVETPGGIPVTVYNNKEPEYYTIIDELYLVFDSYNSDEDVILSESSSMAVCSYFPAWTIEDDFVPVLPTEMFPTYLSMVKRAAFLYLKREQSVHDERFAIAGMGRALRSPDKINFEKTGKTYGRNK